MSRVLLVGLGRWGRQHLRVLGALGAEVFAADLEPRQLETASGTVPRDHLTSDFRRFLSRVDAVDVVTPAPDHFPVCKHVLATGKDCFVEKPLTATLPEARVLLDEARGRGARLQVGHVFRFHPAYERLTAVVASGRLGGIRYVTGRFGSLKRPRLDGGVTQSDAIHFLDLFNALLGRPRAVTAVVRDFLGRGADDWSRIVVEYDGAVAALESDCFGPESRRELLVVGERGACVADFAGWTVTLHPGHHQPVAGHWVAEPAPPEVIPVPRDEPLRRELEAFLAGIRTREPAPVDAVAGCEAVALAWAASLASARGRRVALDELGA
ncbi:MAG TPA: Gfo/Idh/MocA family oxidoreductase [Methylomirabilota bacterium]|nr:Gfo/Idh/MocA family oxidoreductase [Methylomirabilota bacterium]